MKKAPELSPQGNSLDLKATGDITPEMVMENFFEKLTPNTKHF